MKLERGVNLPQLRDLLFRIGERKGEHLQLEGALNYPLIADTFYMCVYTIICASDVDSTSSVDELALKSCYTRCRILVAACSSAQLI